MKPPHWTGHGIQECLKQLQSKNKDLGLLERLSKRERALWLEADYLQKVWLKRWPKKMVLAAPLKT